MHREYSPYSITSPTPYNNFLHDQFMQSNSHPRCKDVILPVISAVCSSPQHILEGVSFFSQNLLGTLSANLLFPKVNTAPDSGAKKLKDKEMGDDRIVYQLEPIKLTLIKVHFISTDD